jgi:hypothetical protein
MRKIYTRYSSYLPNIFFYPEYFTAIGKNGLKRPKRKSVNAFFYLSFRILTSSYSGEYPIRVHAEGLE